jgi:hypothetical protein
VLSSLALNIFEADITDRFYYVPIAAIVALRYALPSADGVETAEQTGPAGAAESAEPPPEPTRRRAVSPAPRRPIGALS